MNITQEESNLITSLDVYGCWLCRYSKQLPKDNDRVKQLVGAYTLYFICSDRLTIALLESCIKVVAEELGLPLGTDCETALAELKEFRQTTYLQESRQTVEGKK